MFIFCSPVTFGFNKVAVQRELLDQRIDLTKTQRQLRMTFEIAADEELLASACFESNRARLICRRRVFPAIDSMS
jgi:hypothetical protein